MPILLQIDETHVKDKKQFKKDCKMIQVIMEKAVIDGFFKNNWSDEAKQELKKYGPLDSVDVVEETEDGKTVMKIGIVFAEA